jgi:hypothetical protein
VLRITSLTEQDAPTDPEGVCGLTAPCSLPAAFLEHLHLEGPRERTLAALEAHTPNHLFSLVRSFASRRTRGSRHPARAPQESLSSLDRRRLPLFCASIPLLRKHPTLPWGEAPESVLFEVDPPAFLDALDLPSVHLSGEMPGAIERRVRILGAFQEGVAGIPPGDLVARDLAVASYPALCAVIATIAAAWISKSDTRPEGAPLEAWIPLPR